MEKRDFTLKELKQIEPNLARLINAPLEARIGFRMRRFAKKVFDVLQQLEEARLETVKTLGERNEESGELTVLAKNLDLFDAQYTDLLKEIIPLEFEKIKISVLTKIYVYPIVDRKTEKVPYFSMLDFGNLEFLIEDDLKIGIAANEAKDETTAKEGAT